MLCIHGGAAHAHWFDYVAPGFTPDHHVRSLALVCNWLRGVFDPLSVVQSPAIDVSPEDTLSSEPEPDATVLTHSVRELFTRVQPDKIRLLVEVSGASLHSDLTTKSALYARALIPEYWVVDLNGRRIVVHQDPAHGQYRSVIAYSDNESVSPLAALSARVRVSDLL